MASHVAPVLTVPQARALLAAIPWGVQALEARAADAETLDLSGRELRGIASDARSLSLAAEALRRVLPPTEGTP